MPAKDPSSQCSTVLMSIPSTIFWSSSIVSWPERWQRIFQPGDIKELSSNMKILHACARMKDGYGYGEAMYKGIDMLLRYRERRPA